MLERSPRLRYTEHAEERMGERRISRADVETVLADPDIDLPRGRKPGRVYARRLGSRKITVVVGTDTDPPTVITVGDD